MLRPRSRGDRGSHGPSRPRFPIVVASHAILASTLQVAEQIAPLPAVPSIMGSGGGNRMQVRTVTTAAAALVAVALTTTACASSRSTAGSPGNPGAAVMYALTEEQADQILVMSIAAQFPGLPMSRVEYPHKGYQVTSRFALDSHDVVALMVPAQGRDAEGTTVSGYVFEVNDSGTRLIVKRRATKLFERIQQNAALAARPLPLAGYGP